MFAIFIISFICIFCIAIGGAWIANKLLISMKRDNHKYELEIKNDFENRKTKGEKEK